MKFHGGRALVLALAMTLGGCESMVDFSTWAAGFDKAIEKSHDQNMLINMVRAAYNRPLHFETIAVARGSGSATPGFSLLGAFPLHRFTEWGSNGAQLTSAGPSLSVTGQYNFDMASLDNSEFTAGLLTPIAPTTVNFYVNEGVPRELLFNLLVDRVTISDGTHKSTYVNDPTQAGYKDFLITLRNLLDLGLTTESLTLNVPFGPPLTTEEMKNPRTLGAIAEAAKAGAIPQPIGNGSYQLVKPIVQARFCFTGGGPNMPTLPASAMCGADAHVSAAEAQKDALAKSQQTFAAGSSISGFENASLVVGVRSTRDVFNYLGNMIYMETNGDKSFHLDMQTKEARDYNYLHSGDELLVVQRNQTASDDIVSIDYDGDTYSIPSHRQGNSALVFTIVSQIMLLSKSINLIPATSAVVVR